MDLQKLKIYYENINIIPVEMLGKKCTDKNFVSFRRYSLKDFNSQSNVAILTGTEVFKNAFSLVLDCDINLHSDEGQKVFNALLPEITDTIIVKSGGKHDGFHVHYLTEVPVRSSLIVFNEPKKGFIEIKGIHERGFAEQMMLPPSINKAKYEVIHPYKADFINFKDVKFLRIEQLKQKLSNIKSIVNKLETKYKNREIKKSTKIIKYKKRKMKKSTKIIIGVSILMLLIASGTAYYKFVYKKEIGKKDDENKQGGKTNDNGGKRTPTSQVNSTQPAKV